MTKTETLEGASILSEASLVEARICKLCGFSPSIPEVYLMFIAFIAQVFLAFLCFSSSSGAAEIRFSGDVTAESVAKLVAQAQSLSAAGDRNITLVLDSGGGDLIAAVRGYGVLKHLGVNTRVAHECFSACTVLFASGQMRSATVAANFMFHAAGTGSNTGIKKAELKNIRLRYAQSWLNIIRNTDASLADRLQRNKTLIRGSDTFFPAWQLRKTGFVND